MLEDRSVPSVVHVTSDADSGPGTLRQAITDVGGGFQFPATIDIDLSGATIQLQSPLPAMGAVTIVGTEGIVTIAGNFSFQLMNFSMSPSEIDNLYLENGHASGNGGALLAGDITINDCVFTSDFSDSNGGAIAARSVNMTGCRFTADFAQDNGGAIYVQGTGGATSYITGTSISSCKATTGDGGGIYSYTNGNLNISSSSGAVTHIYANTAGLDGGNIFSNMSNLYLSGGTSTIIDSGDCGAADGVNGDGWDIATADVYSTSIDCIVGSPDGPSGSGPPGSVGVALKTTDPLDNGGVSINWDLMYDPVTIDGEPAGPPVG